MAGSGIGPGYATRARDTNAIAGLRRELAVAKEGPHKMGCLEFTESDLTIAQQRIRAVGTQTEIPPPEGNRIASEVATHWGMSRRALLSKSQTRVHCAARRDLFIRLRAIGWSYPAIGRFVKRDHATVHNAVMGKAKP